MSTLLITLSAFVLLVLAIEFFAMIFSFEDYGENLMLSAIFAAAIVGMGLGFHIGDKAKESEQERMLKEQEAEMLDVEQHDKLVDQEVEDYFKDLVPNIQPEPAPEPVIAEDTVTDSVTSTETHKETVVPSNRAYIDYERRNYDSVVTYNNDDRTGCSGNSCFKVSLVQHTDGTFWACRRNYGECYQYE